MIDAVFLDKIKSFEGYTPVAKWDYAQFTNGYGTRARAPDEVITKAEAESRFRAEIGKAAQIVERHAANWDPGHQSGVDVSHVQCGYALDFVRIRGCCPGG
jgi:lysozyme